MKKFLVLSFLFTSLNIYAEDFRFTYFGNEGRNRVFLSCHYVEGSTTTILKTLGLENVDVRCTGGLSPIGSYFPVTVTATFNFPADKVASVLKSQSFSSNCFFDTKFIKALTDEFKNQFTVKKSRSGCFRSDSNYLFEIETL